MTPEEKQQTHALINTLNVTLKPCPFCGGTAGLEITPAVVMFMIQCPNCHGTTYSSMDTVLLRDADKSDAAIRQVVGRWNLRNGEG